MHSQELLCTRKKDRYVHTVLGIVDGGKLGRRWNIVIDIGVVLGSSRSWHRSDLLGCAAVASSDACRTHKPEQVIELDGETGAEVRDKPLRSAACSGAEAGTRPAGP
jgi:hypothetical protein